MTSVDAVPTPSPRPWGILMTAVWAVGMVIVVIVALVVAGGAVMGFVPGIDLDSPELLTDSRVMGLTFIVIVLVEIAILAAAARLKGWRATDYLGLVPPSRRETMIGMASIVTFVLFLDTMTYLLGQDVVTPFQIDLYRNAIAAGALPLMWIVLVIAAPVGEEILFRGFLYRGWAQTPRSVLPAVIVISALWAIIHTQYDWFGIFQVFLIGLLLGWVRWRSGSTPLTMLLHGIMNAWATVQTIVKVEWLSS